MNVNKLKNKYINIEIKILFEMFRKGREFTLFKFCRFISHDSYFMDFFLIKYMDFHMRKSYILIFHCFPSSHLFVIVHHSLLSCGH